MCTQAVIHVCTPGEGKQRQCPEDPVRRSRRARTDLGPLSPRLFANVYVTRLEELAEGHRAEQAATICSRGCNYLRWG